MSRRLVLTYSSLAATFMLLTQFQNCAPAAGGDSDLASHEGEVRVIEDQSKADISFVSEVVEVRDEAARADVSGFCQRARSGQKLRWTLWAGTRNDGAEVAAGESGCERGQFRVGLEDLDNMVCGVDHLLVVEGAWGAFTFTHVWRRCQPLASEVVAAPEGSPMGTSCALEYHPGAEVGTGCMQVCYREDKVVSALAVEEKTCTPLLQKLAGP